MKLVQQEVNTSFNNVLIWKHQLSKFSDYLNYSLSSIQQMSQLNNMWCYPKVCRNENTPYPDLLQCHCLQSSPLESNISLPVLCPVVEIIFHECVQHLLCFCFNFFICLTSSALQFDFHHGEENKVIQSQVRQIWQMRWCFVYVRNFCKMTAVYSHVLSLWRRQLCLHHFSKCFLFISIFNCLRTS